MLPLYLPRFLSRLAPIAAALAFVAAPPVRAQETPCVDGEAAGYACQGVDLLAHLTLQDLGAPQGAACGPYTELCAAELWGWVDPETGSEIAVVAVANGTVFVDVTEPTAPVVLGRLPTATQTTNWRTLRTYADHVFVGSEANGHGVQVFDLTRLRDVANPPETFTADTRYTGVSNTHTLDINEESGFLYLAGTNTCAGGLHIVDVRDPLDPTFAGCFDEDGYTHEAQCLTYDGPDTDHTGKEICAAYNEDHVAFVDVTDPANPSMISTVTYPNTGYTHQGWFTADKRHILLDDEFDDANPGTRTIVLDVADLDNAEFAFDFFGTTRSAAHNLYVVGDYAFLSDYTSGLRILDVSGIDEGAFEEVAFFDTYPADDRFAYAGQWMNYPFFPSEIVVATDGAEGLFVLRPRRNTVAEEPTPGPAGYALSEAVPNPAHGQATFTLAVAEPQRVRALAFDALGRRVATLFDGMVGAGVLHPLALETAALPPGAYVVRVTGEGFAATRRVTVVR